MGFEKHIVNKLEDFFQINYPADSKRFKYYHFRSGAYIRGNKKTGPLYMIEKSVKIAGKNEWLIILRPYITPDPRSIYRKR